MLAEEFNLICRCNCALKKKKKSGGGGGRGGVEACWGGRGRGACNFKNVICTKSKLTQEERPL